MIITIDGPAGAGKSTVAAALARRLGVVHVDTGAYYRAVTLAVLRAGIDPADEQGCARVAQAVRVQRRAGRTLLDGNDVEDEIRGETVTRAVSAVARHAPVRQAMVGLQRAAVGPDGAVVEGRDAGTVVVPDADLKVWLTAAPTERAARRAGQARRSGDAALAALRSDLEDRDQRDSEQMARAADAVLVDTTNLDVEQVVDSIVALTAADPRMRR